MLLALLLDLLLLPLLLVAGPIYLILRMIRGKPMVRLTERLGGGPAPFADGHGGGPRVWVHGVSVGEVLAARKLISLLQAADCQILVTSTTTAGLETAEKTYPDVPVRAWPFDLGFALWRFFRKADSDALVLMELELWPRAMAMARRRGVPVVLVNGKLSEASAGRYRRLQKLRPGFLTPLELLLLQEEEHAARFRDLGVPDDRLRVLGNLKLDNLEPRDPESLRGSLREAEAVLPGHRILVAGSTHDPEEAFLLDAMEKVWRSHPDVHLWLAPRHSHRLPSVEALLAERGLPFSRRSEGHKSHAERILLIDTMGELGDLYAAGDFAFVGGTWAPIGGHNLLEPAAWAVPLAVGPHVGTVRAAASALEVAGGLVVVESATDLVSLLDTWCQRDNERAAAGQAAQELLHRNRGATDEAAKAILRLISEP